jgi:hypothetical protein
MKICLGKLYFLSFEKVRKCLTYHQDPASRVTIRKLLVIIKPNISYPLISVILCNIRLERHLVTFYCSTAATSTATTCHILFLSFESDR